jgi:hypothetical protein
MGKRKTGNIKGFRHLVMLVVWGCAGFSAQTFADEDTSKDETTPPANHYQLGQGLRLGDSGFVLGGYTSLEYQAPHSADLDSRLSLSHLSAFLWWEGSSRLKFFSELDSEDTLATGFRSEKGERRQTTLERFYFDYTFADLLTVRAGKFLTPIGRWNLAHADPLVWTTSRPLLSSNVFPDNATGLMAMGNLPIPELPTDYSVYASLGRDPHRDKDQDTFNEAYGLRLNFGVTTHAQVGISYARFTQQTMLAEHKKLIGADWLWALDGYELSAEGVLRFSSEGTYRDVKGGFVQAVAPVPGVRNLYAVGRLESLRQPEAPHATRVSVLGLNYRFTPATAFKVEYVHASYNINTAPDGLLASFCLMF